MGRSITVTAIVCLLHVIVGEVKVTPASPATASASAPAAQPAPAPVAAPAPAPVAAPAAAPIAAPAPAPVAAPAPGTVAAPAPGPGAAPVSASAPENDATNAPAPAVASAAVKPKKKKSEKEEREDTAISRGYQAQSFDGKTEEGAGDWICAWVPGDGVGTKEEFKDGITGQACINECIKMKNNEDETISGATIKSKTEKDDDCWCERGMHSIKKNSRYETCLLQRPGYTTDNYRCMTVAGGATSASYSSISPFISAQDCVDKCSMAKDKDDNVNGVTINFGPNPSCGCHVGMSLMKTNVRNSRTCFLVPIQRFGYDDYVCNFQYGMLAGASMTKTDEDKTDYNGCMRFCVRKNANTVLRGVTIKYDGTECKCYTQTVKTYHMPATPAAYCLVYKPEEIETFRGIATGSSYTVPPNLSVAYSSSCKRIYTVKNGKVSAPLTAQIPTDMDIEKHSRGFVNLKKVVITEALKGGVTPSMTWSSCDATGTSRGHDFKAVGVTVTSPYKPLPWLQLEKGVVMTIEFDWRTMLLKGGDAWNAMKLEGSGRAMIGEGNDAESATIAFTKKMRDANKAVDADVKVEMKKGTGGNLKLTDFLKIFNKKVSDLFPNNPVATISGLNMITIEAYTWNIFAEVSTDGEFFVRIDGDDEVINCPFLEAMSGFAVICQQPKAGLEVTCALIATARPFFILFDEEEKVVGNNVNCWVRGRCWVPDLAQNIRFFMNSNGGGSKWPSNMLLLTSKDVFPTILSEETTRWVKDYIYNEEATRASPEESEEIAIYADSCFRWKMDDLTPLKWPAAYNDKHLLVSMCPLKSGWKLGYTFYLPDIGPVLLHEIGPMLSATGQHPDLVKINRIPDQTLDFIRMEYSYDLKIVLKPRVINAMGPDGPDGFKFSAIFPFMLIRENEITITLTRSSTSIDAEGVEEFLGKKANYKIKIGYGTIGEDNWAQTPVIKYTNMKFEKHYFLLKSLNAELDIVPKEFTIGEKDEFHEDTLTFKSPLAAMGSGGIVLSNLETIPMTSTDSILRFYADSPLPTVSNARYSFLVQPDTTNPSRFSTSTCRFHEGGGRVSDFINDIQDETFFDLSFVGYEKIGVIYQMLPETTFTGGLRAEATGQCEADVCCIWSKHVTTPYWQPYQGEGSVPDKADDVHWVKIQGLSLHDRVCKDPVTNKERPPCTFLRRLFPTKRDLEKALFYGHMDKNGLWLRTSNILSVSVSFSRNLKLHDPKLDLKVRIGSATDPTLVGRRTEFVLESDEMSIHGGGAQWGTVFAAIRIALTEESVSLQITQLKIHHSLHERYIGFFGQSTYSYLIDPETPPTHIITKLPMKVKYASDLYFNDPERNVAILDPAQRKFIRMIACREEDLEFVDLLDNMNVKDPYNDRPIRGFSDIQVTDLCIYFNALAEDWEWEEVGISIPTGMTMRGSGQSQFDNFITDEKEAIPVKIHMHHPVIIPESRELCVTLPPQRYGNDVAYPTDVDRPIMEIFEKKKDPNKVEQSVIGPDYCYVIGKLGGATGMLKGYLKSFIYNGNVDIDITDANAVLRDMEFNTFSFETRSKLMDKAMGTFKLKGAVLQNHFDRPWMIDWDIEVNIEGLDEEKFTNARDHLLGPWQKIKDLATEWRRELTLAKNLALRRDSIENDTSVETKYQAKRMELRRSIRAMEKDCDDDCGFTKLPGWKVDKGCGISSTGQPLKCLNYANDSNVARDVGCMALCEAERVKSFADAKDLHKEAREIGVLSRRRTICQNAGDELNTFASTVESQVRAVTMFRSYDTTRTIQDKIQRAEASNLQIYKFESVVNFRDFVDPNCLNFEVSLNFAGSSLTHTSPDTVRFCSNAFSEDVYKTCYQNTWGNEFAEIELKAKEVQDNDITQQAMDISKLKRLARAKKATCGKRDAISNEERRYTERELPNFSPVEYTLFTPSTMESYDQAPWIVNQANDAFADLQNNKRSKLLQNLTISEKDHPCTVAKRAATDYNDITTYVSKWIKNHEGAKLTLAKSKEFAKNALQRTSDAIAHLRTLRNYTEQESDHLGYWLDKTKNGIDEWISTEDQRLKRFNEESMPLIRKELEFVYTDDKYKTLSEFFQHRGVDGTNAFKKANIATPEKSFSDISKTLLNVLQKSKTLDEAAAPINDAVKQVERLSKRSVICTA